MTTDLSRTSDSTLEKQTFEEFKDSYPDQSNMNTQVSNFGTQTLKEFRDLTPGIWTPKYFRLNLGIDLKRFQRPCTVNTDPQITSDINLETQIF